jgi:hypothetical protein
MGPENQGHIPPEAKKPLSVAETELEKNWFVDDEDEKKPPEAGTDNDENIADAA